MSWVVLLLALKIRHYDLTAMKNLLYGNVCMTTLLADVTVLRCKYIPRCMLYLRGKVGEHFMYLTLHQHHFLLAFVIIFLWWYSFLLLFIFFLFLQLLHVCIIDLPLQRGIWVSAGEFVHIHSCSTVWKQAWPKYLFETSTWLAVAEKTLRGGGSVWQLLSYREIKMTTESLALGYEYFINTSIFCFQYPQIVPIFNC